MNRPIFTMLSIAFSLSLQLGARQLTQAVWVYPQAGSDPVADAGARRTMIDNTAASDVTDLYVSVYQSTVNSAGRLMYPDASMADLIQQAHRKHIKIWAAYGAPDWPSLGCAVNSFPMRRMAEVNGCNGDTAGTALAANLETAVGEPPNRSTSAARRHDTESSCHLPGECRAVEQAALVAGDKLKHVLRMARHPLGSAPGQLGESHGNTSAGAAHSAASLSTAIRIRT